jgi:phenylalanine-4-hydroxylase
MRTRYKIDSFQQTYFVIDSFEQLFAMTDPDFGPMYERLRNPNWQPMRAIRRWRQRHGRRKLPRFSLHVER